MTPIDAYVANVKRHMVGMDPRVREDILRELRSHIQESTAANGGDMTKALARMGSPSQVGRESRELYGYGRIFQMLFLAVAGAAAIPTVPVLGVLEEGLAPYSLSLPFLAVLVAWLLWVGFRAGSTVGLLAGLTACVTRLVVLGGVALLQPGAVFLGPGVGAFVAVSAFLIVLGWLPGTAKKAWSGPKAEL